MNKSIKNKSFLTKITLMSIFVLFYTGIITAKTKITLSKIDKNSKKVNLDVNLEKGDFIYKDFIEISVDHPEIKLSKWNTDSHTVNHFSKDFRETKKIYNKNFTISLEASKAPETVIKNANIHLSYYLNSKKRIIEETIPLDMEDHPHIEHEEFPTNVDTTGKVKKKKTKSKKKPRKKSKPNKSWASYLQDVVKTTESVWVQIFLALLLGGLLSLTPCIYPMIPITVGILQAQGSKSIFHNFMLSMLYVTGISISFAILGLIAAFTGQIFGSILANPLFVTAIVALLVYLALSMFGFYEIYIPKFLQKTGDSPTNKSLLSIFLFGLLSGTIASPCVSPGLILLLSIVTTLGSKILGFLLLFAFGMGLGTPLLIVGTFSGSMNMLPRAGGWMMEIKKILGILLFVVCFYFLSNIFPWHIILWLISGFTLLLGIYYLYSVSSYDSRGAKIFKNIMGISCCAISVVIAFNALKEKYIGKPKKTVTIKTTKETTIWKTDYKKAIEQAINENKKVFLDFGASWCSVCKVIDKKKFKNPDVLKALSNKFVNVKIDGSDMSNEPFASLKKKYKIMGFPTFLIIDPNTETIIKRWSSELNSISNEKFISIIEQY